MIVNLMKVINQPTNDNDYAVAYALNNCVLGIIAMIVMADIVGKPEDTDIRELNRAYVLVTDELEKLYDCNPKLAAIKPEPIWKRFVVLKTSSWEINEFLDDPDNDMGQAHNARVEKLMILAGKDTPDFTPEQKKLLDYADSIRIKYGKITDELNKERLAKKGNDDKLTPQSPQEYGGQIAKLSLVQKTLKLNVDGVTLTLKHFDSTKRFNYNLAKLLLARPDEWIKKEDLGPAFKTMGSKVKDWPKLMGFTGELKDIFINVNTKEQTIVLNPNKSLTPDEAEILKRLVNTPKSK